MEDVRAQYAELKDTMSTFQVSVSECLSKAEAEFLQAYRAHMVEVHRELQGLRDKLSEAESSILKDDHIQQLERDGAWYRNEAAQQTAYIAAMDKDRSYMRRKYETLEADRKWLSRQLKASKKQHKLLQAELKARNIVEDAAPDAEKPESRRRGAREGRRGADHVHHMPKSASAPGLFGVGGRRKTDRGHRSSVALGGAAALFGGAGDDASSRGDAALDPAALTVERQLASEVAQLRRELEVKSEDAVRLRGVLVAERTRMTDLQEFFGRCVADLERHNAKRTTTRTHAVPPETFQLLGELMFPAADDAADEPAPPPESPARAASLPALGVATQPRTMAVSASGTSLCLDGDTLNFLNTLKRQ
jgi:hypothetical protein